MTAKIDLTRWNRAGLRHFQYIDGNAVEYMEILRTQLGEHFPIWESLFLSSNSVSTGTEDEELQRKERILAQYHGKRGDWGFEIVRSFARACHVLTEHIGAYANESYLGTATQWDHVRRLVEMLDYHPAPPSSASTLLVLEAKAGLRGNVAKGFQVKHTPPQGGAPVIFETLADLEIDYRLNGLRHQGWDRSPIIFNPFECDEDESPSPWKPSDKTKISVGQFAVLVEENHSQQEQPESGLQQSKNTEESARPTTIVQYDREAGYLCIGPDVENYRPKKGYVRLLAPPKKVYVPHLNGDDVFSIEYPHGLAVGDVVAWISGGGWYFDTVSAVEEQSLRLSNTAYPNEGNLLYKALNIPYSPDGVLRIPLQTLEVYYRSPFGEFLDADPYFEAEEDELEDGSSVVVARKYIEDSAPSPVLEVFILGPDPATVGRVSKVGQQDYVFDGSPGKLTSGDWLVGEGVDKDKQSALWALRIESIVENEDSFELILAPSMSVRFSTPAERDLLHELRKVEIALDQEIIQTITLDDLLAGILVDYPINNIQGIAASYAAKLRQAGIHTIADLAQLDLSQISRSAGGPGRTSLEDIPSAWLREFKTKAEIITGFTCDNEVARQYSGIPLIELVTMLSLGPVSGSDAMTVSAPDNELAELIQLHGPFADTLYPVGYDRNETPIDVGTGELVLDVAQLPETLKPGRTILIEQETTDEFTSPRQAVIDRIVNQNTIKLHPPLREKDGFTYGNIVIRGNAVVVGHGVFKGEKVLGSGDFTQLNQSFNFNVNDVSFIADSTMPAGVRADIAIIVDGQTWKQVHSLRDSEPTDPHYTVRMTEEGHLRIGFGDGIENGRRLPSGINNIRVTYRVGSGINGNVPSRGLEKPVKPHKLVARVRQPIAATGGNDMEDVSALRENAPASLLTLERAVSLKDFANLTTSQSNVWQAHAFTDATPLGHQEGVRVVIVPAGGSEFDDHLQADIPIHFLDEQRDYLQAHAIPGMAVRVDPYEPVLINLTVNIRLKSSEYDPEETKEAVQAQLIATFSLERRDLGHPLYRSELYKVVESVRGVENSDCRLSLYAGMEDRPKYVGRETVGDDGIIRYIRPLPKQVIYVDTRYSSVKVTPEEFVL